MQGGGWPSLDGTVHSKGGTPHLSGLGSLARRTLFAGHSFKAPQVGKATWAADGRGGGGETRSSQGTRIWFLNTPNLEDRLSLLSTCIIYSMKSTNEL